MMKGSASRSIKRSSSDPSAVMRNARCMSSTRVLVLSILCLQNSMFTVLRRYSQGILKAQYSMYEVLLVGEFIKIVFSVWMISKDLAPNESSLGDRLKYLAGSSGKMLVLALIYGAMNILSFVSLRNIGAGTFTIFAQCKILSTAVFSTIILGRKYSWTKWRALLSLFCGVLLFSQPIWGKANNMYREGGNPALGIAAVLIEVTFSGFASIYFEKVIKTDSLKVSIWERNFQLALGSVPVYIVFIMSDTQRSVGEGWSAVAALLAMLGAGGGLLVALSIKYGDSILKTLATTGAIILSSVLDNLLMDGPLTFVMIIAGVQVIIAISNYTFSPNVEASTLPERKEGIADLERQKSLEMELQKSESSS